MASLRGIVHKLPTCLARANFYVSICFPKPNDDLYDQSLNDREYLTLSQHHFKQQDQSFYIIQPYVKWGMDKLRDITPEEQLNEAKALVKTLPSWIVVATTTVPLENLEKKTLFKSGSLERLCNDFRELNTADAIFINIGTLRKAQLTSLEKEFGVPVLDRYKVVMYILKLHATSKHAKLQVALAELYYLQRTTFGLGGKTQHEKVKLMFQMREQKLKSAIEDLRSERSLLRSKRQKSQYPIVAVVGYTNAGKTSLIKALTGEGKLVPKNQLFATLDVTMHAGMLPSGLEVLYVDTVGFIADIPTNLIECFVATLEDAVLADVILHVEDVSDSCLEFKRKHVLNTLVELGQKAGCEGILDKVISVGNKCDIVDQKQDFGLLKISSKMDIGLDVLRFQVEEWLLRNTDRRRLRIRVPNGGYEVRWLYKNCTVVAEEPDEKNPQFIRANVIITNGKLQQFKHHFAPCNDT